MTVSTTRRDFLSSSLSLAGLSLLDWSTPACGADVPAAQPRLGINLNGPADWNTELPFVDVFRFSRRWISQRTGEAWGKGPELDLDEHGWVRRLEPGCWAETPLCNIDGGHYPGGKYTILYDGRGEIEIHNAAEVVAEEPGQLVVDIDSAKGNFWLRVRATDPGDYVHNIRVVMPGFEQTYREQPFHPTFLQHWQGVACVRFMDWMHTNGSKVATWSDRPQPDDATFTTTGVALETMIDLANRLPANPWFCMPHLADDDYVRQFADMVSEQLAPGLKVYVEYSNEVWNGQFAQNKYAGEQGLKLGFAEKPWEAAWRYTAVRSLEIFRLWEQVFGSHDRIVRVLPSQSANPYVSEQILKFQDACQHADVLAIAPYIACNVPPEGKDLTASTVATWSVDQALDYMEQTSLPKTIEAIRGQKETADQYGLKLVAYEAGQHMVGVRGAENNETLTRLFQAANAHPRMGDIYDQYYAAWTSAGGDLMCHFSSVGRWSKYGSWGIMQHYDDDPLTSPKFAATMRWARRCGQPVAVSESR